MDIHTLAPPPLLAIHLLAIETLAGMLFFLHAVVMPASEDRPGDILADAEAWCRRVGLCCLVAALLSMIVWLGAVAASVSGAEQFLATDVDLISTVIRQTQFGLVWLGRFGLALVLALIIGMQPTRRSLAEDNLPWAGLLLLTFALTGHGGAGGHHSILLTLTAVHLAATAAWIGSLPLLAWILACAGRDFRAVPVARAVVARYAAYGVVAVGILALSGAAMALIMLSGQRGALSSPFALVLWGKLALVATMGGMALVNRFWLSPALRDQPHPEAVLQRMWRIVILEYGVGSFVLLAAAILGQTTPPMG